MIPSSLQDVLTRNMLQNQSIVSVTIETFDALCEKENIREAIEVVDIFEDNGDFVDLPRLLGLAKLCGQAETLEEARVVHDGFITASSHSDVGSCNRIIEMYVDCGSINDASKVFNEMPERNSETWCVMMRCLAKNGQGELTIYMFTRFKKEGKKPDKEIFKTVFAACALLGDINEGVLYFEAMHKDYGIIPSMEDDVIVTEMIAACGHLDEALEFVERMNVEPSVEVWETLMNLCWVHGDLELGDRFAELVKNLDVTRMNNQSNAGLVAVKASDTTKENLKEMILMRRKKRRRREFRAEDTSHPDSDKIYAALKSLRAQMLEMGYVPATQVYREIMEEEDKKEQLLSRMHKLFFTHGFLTTKARSPLHVVANLRICINSHNTCKLISVITDKSLISRDKKKFHHFKNGVSSCGDYW